MRDKTKAKQTKFIMEYKNSYDIVQIKHVHIHSTERQMYIQFQVFHTNISGIIDMNVAEREKIWLPHEKFLGHCPEF